MLELAIWLRGELVQGCRWGTFSYIIGLSFNTRGLYASGLEVRNIILCVGHHEGTEVKRIHEPRFGNF